MSLETQRFNNVNSIQCYSIQVRGIKLNVKQSNKGQKPISYTH